MSIPSFFVYPRPAQAPATNRIATATNDQGTVGLSYDAAGNLTQDGSAVYNYDAANRLKEVGVGGSNTYGYDGDGMRVRQSSGGAAMFYVRSSVLRNVAMEVTATGGAVRAYVQAGNKTVAMSSRDGQFYWLHTNHLNSSRAMTDINGTLVYKGQYDPYGKALLEWSATNDTGLNARKFTGYERDATGLDYANARMYASERGRFLQPDKLGLGAAKANRPQSFNRYAYTGNDPINFVDPTGLDEEPFTILITTLEPHAQPAGPRADVFGGSFLPEDGNPEREIGGEPLTSQSGRKQLSAADQKRYEAAKRLALNLSDDCKKGLGDALNKHGKSLNDLYNAINKQKPFDANLSTINVVEAGIIRSDFSSPLIMNATLLEVKDFFSVLASVDPAIAATGFWMNNTKYDTYFIPENISSRVIIHEALHSLFEANDSDLAFILGRKDVEELLGSAWINDRLFKWSCGE